MAYYKASQVIKMRRNALGHSREEYDAEGPSYQTIYRLEHGKVHVKERTYRRLSKAMGEEESTKQGVLHTGDISVLWLINEISFCFSSKNFERAEELIQQLESKLDISVEKNRRYLSCIKADLLYCKGNLESGKYKEVIEESLLHGSVELEELLERKWPFEEVECNRILSLIEVVRKEKDYERQKKLLEQLLTILDTEYMETEYNTVYQIVVRYRMGDVLGNMGFHREAILLDEETIAICEEHQDWRFLPEVYYDIFWNYMMVKKKETLTEQEESHSKDCLLKAYYLGKAKPSGKNLYKKRVQEFYPEELL